MKLKIKFVGTGSGKTSLDRYHSSILINYENYNLLIDAGDGISRALISCNIDFNSIDGIIFTHLHPDHFAGFPSLIVQMKMNNRKHPLDIFMHKSLKDFIKEFLLYSNLLPERMKFEINYKTFSEGERILISKNFFLVAKRNSHLSKLESYSSQYANLNFLSLSLLVEVQNKRLIYTSDIGSEEDLFLFNQNPSDIFITEATHLKPEILINSLPEINTERIILSHLTDEDTETLSAILTTQTDDLKNKTSFGFDGLSLEI